MKGLIFTAGIICVFLIFPANIFAGSSDGRFSKAQKSDYENDNPKNQGINQELDKSLPQSSEEKARLKGLQVQLRLELEQAIENRYKRLAELNSRFKNATSEYEAMEISKDIDSVKSGMEVEVMRIQADHARKMGQNSKAEKIEEALERLLNVQKSGSPPQTKRNSNRTINNTE